MHWKCMLSFILIRFWVIAVQKLLKLIKDGPHAVWFHVTISMGLLICLWVVYAYISSDFSNFYCGHTVVACSIHSQLKQKKIMIKWVKIWQTYSHIQTATCLWPTVYTDPWLTAVQILCPDYIAKEMEFEVKSHMRLICSVLSNLAPECSNLCEVIIISGIVTCNIAGSTEHWIELRCLSLRSGEAVGVIVWSIIYAQNNTESRFILTTSNKHASTLSNNEPWTHWTTKCFKTLVLTDKPCNALLHL